MPIQLFPFNGGIQGQIDTRLLPDGALSDAVNCQLDREGRLVGRAGFTALGTTIYGSGSFVGYDLFESGDRLFALGDRFVEGYPTDVFEYTPGSAAVWSPTSRTEPRLPKATRVRDLGRPPDVAGGCTNFSVAATSGFVCLAFNVNDPDASRDSGYAHIVKAAQDQTVDFEELTSGGGNACQKLRAIGLSDRFIIVGLSNLADHVSARRFIPASDESTVSLAVGIITGLGTITALAVCKVAGSDQFMAVAATATTVVIRRFDNTATVVVPSGGQYANVTAAVTHLAVEASSTANQVAVAMVVGGECRLFSYNLTTGATLSGPVVAFSTFTSTEISLVRLNASFDLIVSSITSTTPKSVQWKTFFPANGTLGGTAHVLPDARLASTALLHGGLTDLAFAFRTDLDTGVKTSNFLVALDVSNEAEILPLIAKDFETAAPDSLLLPEVTQDASTGKWYWANAAENADLDSGPIVTEFSLGAAERRQTTRLGGQTYIAGGVPTVFDGRGLCECGYPERPRIVSLTGSNSTGEILSSGTYNYRVHLEQIDANGDLHLSPPSAIKQVTLGASDDTVTGLVTSTHGLRRSSTSSAHGVAVRHVLSRSLGTVSSTAAVVTGALSIDPPGGSLTGLTLIVTAGGTSFTVTFSGSATTKTVVLSEINAVVSAELTATAPNGVLILTSVDTGDGATVQVLSGTANTLLGLAAGDNDTGVTTRTVGENFQRAAMQYNSTAAATIPGGTVSVVDLRKDQSDPIVDTDLIRQQVLYSSGVASGAHHAPPPSDYVWAGRERVHFSGQPKRNRSTASKLIVPGEPAECAADGFLAFQSQVSGDIEATAVLGDSVIHWTRNEIWEVSGSGPGRNGQGEFFAARRISKAGGIVADGWRSLCETDDGVFFQRKSDQLCFLTKSGTVEWKGEPVQEYLVLYPVITCSVYLSARHTVAFGVTNTAGNTGGILRYDLAADAWFFDNVGAVTAMSQYQGRIVYLQAGVAYLEDAAPGTGTFVPYLVRSGMFQGFQALGYGQVNEIGFLGTFRDDCVVTIKRSANGTSFSETLATFTLTTAQYAVGQRVTLLKSPNPAMQDSFALEYSITSASADSEGVWLHAAALDTTHAPRFSRQGPAHKL